MRRCGRVVAVALAAAVLWLLPGAPARASQSTEVIQGRYVRIVSTADWAAASALAGASVRWELTVSADAPDPGRIRLGMSGTGTVALVADVSLCTSATADGACTSPTETLRTDWAIPRDGVTVPLDAVPSDRVAHVRIDVRMEGAGAPGASTQLRVHADGLGDRLETGPTDPTALATTGAAPPVVVIVAAGLLIAAGTGTLRAWIRRGRRGEGSR
ncbi:hypothetical protein [uncultured Microbacterium sp.]|uniref:hypothetical protein n=1 Tax=uncultured Microbacterium sp. TaxID=191216 RepID=UPI0025CDB02A|nr:hypothetical protein [uncultured Microbacterium sp.]